MLSELVHAVSRYFAGGLSNLNFVSITSYVFVFSCYDDICHQ